MSFFTYTPEFKLLHISGHALSVCPKSVCRLGERYLFSTPLLSCVLDVDYFLLFLVPLKLVRERTLSLSVFFFNPFCIYEP